jgi:hypothetical protein
MDPKTCGPAMESKPYRKKKKRFEYGPLTAPNPDRIALIVTPIMPTLDMPHSTDRMPGEYE